MHGSDWTVPAHLGSIMSGLYVMVFTNDGAAVRDDNKGREKVIVHAGGASLKSGKFEHGLEDLAWRYHSHLLRDVSSRGPTHILSECLVQVLVLDLTSSPLQLPAARVFEKFWNESFLQWLGARGALTRHPKQLMRSEWRFLMRRHADAPNFGGEVLRHAQRVSAEIARMTDAVR